MMRLHVSPIVGDRLLKEFGAEDADDLVAYGVSCKSLSTSSVNLMLRMTSALDAAVEVFDLVQNPMKRFFGTARPRCTRRLVRIGYSRAVPKNRRKRPIDGPDARKPGLQPWLPQSTR